jgi:cytoskeletal protein CcmA (bactofilin family)
MGLFGRDDRSDGERTEAAAQTTSRRSPSGEATASDGTVIAAPTRIEGTLMGSDEVRIEGQIAGTVDITSRLVVADGGLVEGKVAARSILVAGRVNGDLLAAERIELGPTCRIEGNITAPRILIHDGATFDGHVVMKKPSGWNAESASRSITTSSARRAEPSTQSDSSESDHPRADGRRD